MIKMTTELFEKFSKKQEELDSMIRKKHNISTLVWQNDLNVNHILALKVEMAEFANECHDAWKYWKQKSIVPDRLLDEAVDVIHFMHLLFNKDTSKTDYENVRDINEAIKNSLDVIKEANGNFKGLLLSFVVVDDLYYIYAQLLIILDHYAFTLDDIEQAYDRKNAENHARQNRNY